MNKKKTLVIVAVAAIAALAVWLLSGGKKEEKITFDTAAVAPANIMNSITATGTIEPVTSVTVGTQVSGIVSKLFVDYNSVVKKGQVIAELDKTNLMSQLNTAKTQLATAQSQLNYQTANYKRYKTLFEKGLVAADDFDNAKLSYTQAKEQVASAKEEVQRAQTNLGYATITSPIDGVVLSKSVEEGQTVAASFSTPELFTIAQDLTNMQVVAAGAPGGYHDEQCRYVRGGYLCAERRPEAEAGSHRQRHNLHSRAQGRALRAVEGAALHSAEGDRGQDEDCRRSERQEQGVDHRGQLYRGAQGEHRHDRRHEHADCDFLVGDETVHALRGVSFKIYEGEFVTIMGKSGSGKSTLLNQLGCLDTPSSGEYYLDGVSVRKMSKSQRAVLRNRKIGFIFQNYNLLPKTTSVENVELPLMYNAAIGAKEREERAVKALQAVGLGERLYHKSNQMSGGQMQRVAIARALVNDPAVILADEATGNLDTRTSFEILILFQKLHAAGRTIIFVTHNPDIANYSSRNIMLRDGHVISDEYNKNIIRL